jgi:non-specific serine/threonine protein kinase
LIRAPEGYARCLAAQDPDAAVRLVAATKIERLALAAVPFPRERRYLDGCLSQARRALGRTAFERVWDEGHASTLDAALSFAEALVRKSPTVEMSNTVLIPRELDVARLLAHGLTNKQIATELVLSPGTVRSHVEHILVKLDLHSRAQIGVWAAQQGLLLAER